MAVELLPGNDLFVAELTKMEERCMNFAPAFAIIDSLMLAYEDRRFEREGPGWAPLKESTIIRKVGLLQPILQRDEPGHSEGLKQSLTSHGDGSIFHVTPLSLTMGTSVSYAHFHQKGTEQMPARPPWPDIEEMIPIWIVWRDILQTYLVAGTAGAATAGAGSSLNNA